MLWPNGTKARPPISSPFGPRKAPVPGASTMHRGCDFTEFSLVHAVAAGRVVAVGTPRGWEGGGIQVWVQHDGFLTRYMHLKNTPPVRVGDLVEEGRILGIMGRTGNVSGVHLHLEVVVNGVQIDPIPFITSRLSAVAGGSAAPTPKPQQEVRTMNEFLLIKVLVPGGFRRYIIDPRSEKKREISQIKYDLYKNGGMATVPGDQPKSYADEFADGL